MKLYELSAEFRQIADVLEQLDGSTHEEAVPILRAELDCIHTAIESKLEGCAAMVRTWLAEAEAYCNEAERFTQKAQRTLRRADWLKGYMQRCMEDAGLTKVQAGLFRVSIQQNGGYAPLELDEANLPMEFVRVRSEPDMQAIREAVQAGNIPVGVIVGPRGSHLRIS